MHRQTNDGLTTIKSDNLEATASQYRQALKIKPDDIETLSKLADLYMESEQFDEALAICRQAIKVKPNLAEAYKIEGKIWESKGDFEAAIIAYSKLRELQPKLVKAHLLLGNVYRQQNRLDEAIACYRQCLEIQPKLTNAYMHIGDINRQQKRLEEALNSYQQILNVNPNLDDDYFRRILTLRLAVREQEDLLEQFISLYPRMLEPLSPYAKNISAATNIYHCCVPKTASTWINKLLTDFRIFLYSGLLPFQAEFVKNGNNIPKNAIVTGTFPISYENFTKLEKPELYKAFFVMRDPRDIVISGYFSNRYSHSPIGHISETRKILNSLSIEEGIIYNMETLRDVFEILASWIDAEEKNPNILLLRYEDLTGNKNLKYFHKLCRHCDIKIPEKQLQELISDYSFEKLSGGRKHGEEDRNSHYRKGVSGDWKNYFNEEIKEKFEEIAGHLVTRLGYSWDGFDFGGVIRNSSPKTKSEVDSNANNEEAALPSETTDADILQRQSQVYYREGKLDEAIVACNRELYETYKMRGKILRERGQIEAAISDYSNALKILPDSVEIYLHLAQISYEDNRLDDAINWYQKILKFQPNLAVAYFYIGKIYYQQNLPQQSISYYLKSVEIEPRLADSYFYLGNIYREQNWLDEAISCYSKSIEIEPKLADSYFYLGNIYREQNRLDEAINCYDKALEIQPQLADAYFYLEWIYRQQERVEKANFCRDKYQEIKT